MAWDQQSLSTPGRAPDARKDETGRRRTFHVRGPARREPASVQHPDHRCADLHAGNHWVRVERWDVITSNGGPTQTVALLASSSGVNAIPLSSCTDASGNPVTTDQRGVPRPQGNACDIGAFEYFQSSFMLATVQTFDLEAQVQSLPLPKLPQQLLTVPLQATVASLTRGNVNAAVVNLGAFVLLVDLERLSGGLNQAQAAALTASARQIIQSLRS